MPCYHPLKGYMSKAVGSNGKRCVVFNPTQGFKDLPMEVPCGKCIGCRLDKSREWALRCMHEAYYHDENSFITLTYNDENLPPGATLVVEHFQKFMKRLRQWVAPQKIRFYHCGEYGTCDPDNSKHVQQYGYTPGNLGRPHYHALIFGYDFPDKEFYTHKGGNTLYVSETLEKLWSYGFATIGELNFETAAYTARYCTKKIGGEMKDGHYTRYYEGGEGIPVLPEYATMSRRPGIGARWFKEFGKTDVYPKDYVTHHGKQIKPPRFYDNMLEEENPALLEAVKRNRVASAKDRAADNSDTRLNAKEIVKKTQNSFLKRNLDDA